MSRSGESFFWSARSGVESSQPRATNTSSGASSRGSPECLLGESIARRRTMWRTKSSTGVAHHTRLGVTTGVHDQAIVSVAEAAHTDRDNDFAATSVTTPESTTARAVRTSTTSRAEPDALVA
jgi:hypothetical protein